MFAETTFSANCGDAANDGDVKVSYDLEWLTVLYLTKDLMSYKNLSNYMPAESFTPTDADKGDSEILSTKKVAKN